MKNKKNTLLAIGLLLAVIGLGIGYAISTQSLTIEGTSSWYMRGGVADGKESAGIFSYGSTSGYMGSYATFRMSLVVIQEQD